MSGQPTEVTLNDALHAEIRSRLELARNLTRSPLAIRIGADFAESLLGTRGTDALDAYCRELGLLRVPGEAASCAIIPASELTTEELAELAARRRG